jgi:hypothetical protein
VKRKRQLCQVEANPTSLARVRSAQRKLIFRQINFAHQLADDGIGNSPRAPELIERVALYPHANDTQLPLGAIELSQEFGIISGLGALLMRWR